MQGRNKITSKLTYDDGNQRIISHILLSSATVKIIQEQQIARKKARQKRTKTDWPIRNRHEVEKGAVLCSKMYSYNTAVHADRPLQPT